MPKHQYLVYVEEEPTIREVERAEEPDAVPIDALESCVSNKNWKQVKRVDLSCSEATYGQSHGSHKAGKRHERSGRAHTLCSQIGSDPFCASDGHVRDKWVLLCAVVHLISHDLQFAGCCVRQCCGSAALGVQLQQRAGCRM